MTREIRPLTLTEIGLLLGWAAEEGWNPGLHDAVPFQAADPKGFLGAFVDGRMVAGISAVAYDDAFGFIGLYICHPDWRGQGHGRAVWDAAMQYLGNRTIGLDGVPEQQANYAAMGFVPAYQTIRMSGVLTGDAAAVPLQVAEFEMVQALDAACFPATRPAFLRHWLAVPRSGVMLVEDAVATAYAVVRPCHDGSKIGPLFARDVTTAEALLAGLSGPVQIDVPASQTEWLAGLHRRGFEPGFTTMRMYRGAPPTMTLDRVFGISTLELG